MNIKLNLLFFYCFLLKADSFSQQNQDTEVNEHHLLNILKDHEIIPDIIDAASIAPSADILEVRYMC